MWNEFDLDWNLRKALSIELGTLTIIILKSVFSLRHIPLD